MLAASACMICSTALFELVKGKQNDHRPGEALRVPGVGGS